MELHDLLGASEQVYEVNMEQEPIDCMTCLVHPRHDNCLAVVEQHPGRVLGMRHVVSGWQDAGYGVTLCGLRIRWPGTA